jgi:hypothetical protein
MPFYDNHVWAEKGSYLDGALDNIKVNVSGHHKIISNKEVVRIIRQSVKRF